MKILTPSVFTLALLATVGPSMALDAPLAATVWSGQAASTDLVDWHDRNRRHHPRYGGYVGPNGGYRVNRYGYGNYVDGPGGFAGYPAGSAGAQIYRQKQEWKCQSVPEMC